MNKRRTWPVVALVAVLVLVAAGYWVCTTQQEQGQSHYLPLSLKAKQRMADYYVDNSVPPGGVGTIVDPFDTIAANIGILVAGDTMHVRGDAGAYRVYNEAEIDVVANGTAANPITLQPYGTERVEIRTPAGSNILDLHGDWFVLDGQSTDQLFLNKNDVAGAYAVYVRNTAGDSVTRYTEMGNAQWSGRIMRIEGDRATVQYCIIHDNYNGPATDAAGIGVDDGDDTVIEYCTFYNVHGDLIIVDDTPPNPQSTIIRYNTFYSTLGRCAENGVDMKVGGTAGSPAQIYGNVFHGFRACTGDCGGSGSPRGEAIGIRNDGDYVLIYDNEIYNSTTAIVLDDYVRGITIRNNVIHDLPNSTEDSNATMMAALWIRARDVEIYHNTIDGAPENSIYFYTPLSNVIIENNIFNDCGGITGASLPGWSADYNCWYGCTEVLAGAHDVTSDPLFVDAAGDDYHLTDVSPCIDRGRNVGLTYYGSAPDMGAFEWEPEPEDEPPPAPVAPGVSGGGTTAYQIWLKDWDGRRIAVFTGTGRETGGLRRFSFLKMLRKPGQFYIELDGSDERIESFVLDYQVEFWRRDQFGGLPWYKVFEAFHRSDSYRQTETGQDIYVSNGQHYNVLLLAEPIFYPAGSAYTTKSGPAETVAKEYANENVGPGATSPPRDVSGVMPGLTIEADGGTGASWSGGRARQNLLDVLVELADYAPADFMVQGTDDAQFEFQWRANQWGEDRTWGNAAGIPAVVFDGRLGNARNVLYEHDRKNEINVCHVLGQGSGDERRVVTRTSGAEADSPWNARAVCRDARNTYSTDSLNRKGDEVLDKMRSRVATQVDVAQTAATRFGRDWDIGDLVTVRYRSFEVDQKIIGVRVDVGQDGAETIQAIMEEP